MLRASGVDGPYVLAVSTLEPRRTSTACSRRTASLARPFPKRFPWWWWVRWGGATRDWAD